MTVYVDEFPAGWGKWTGGGHLTTTNIDELHAMATKIGLKREWSQDKTFPHYDCQKRIRALAVAAGAVERDFMGPNPPDTLMRCADGSYETYGERMTQRTTPRTRPLIAQESAPKPRTRRQKMGSELALLRRDGPLKYVRLLRGVRRFNRSVERMRKADGYDD